jgi:hypothetical protein
MYEKSPSKISSQPLRSHIQEEREEKISLIVDTSFRLQCPRAVLALGPFF